MMVVFSFFVISPLILAIKYKNRVWRLKDNQNKIPSLLLAFWFFCGLFLFLFALDSLLFNRFYFFLRVRIIISFLIFKGLRIFFIIFDLTFIEIIEHWVVIGSLQITTDWVKFLCLNLRVEYLCEGAVFCRSGTLEFNRGLFNYRILIVLFVHDGLQLFILNNLIISKLEIYFNSFFEIFAVFFSLNVALKSSAAI